VSDRWVVSRCCLPCLRFPPLLSAAAFRRSRPGKGIIRSDAGEPGELTYHPFPDPKENPTPDDEPKTALVPATRVYRRFRPRCGGTLRVIACIEEVIAVQPDVMSRGRSVRGRVRLRSGN